MSHFQDVLLHKKHRGPKKYMQYAILHVRKKGRNEKITHDFVFLWEENAVQINQKLKKEIGGLQGMSEKGWKEAEMKRVIIL